ncbi:MAG: plasmid pRiA4b ORF-3 family protein [Phycisphaerae bacterium]|nr:plasmid pRiA4b ORF-3 family protein [Phycisphaerae bacterium]
MAASAKAKGKAKAVSMSAVYHLKVVLHGVEPEVWRLLQVPGNANLGWLHAVIQVVLGWTNSHLHQFRDGERTISDPDFELDAFEDSPPVLDERKVSLMQVLPQEGDEVLYEYDFGDSWEHRVTVVKVLAPDAAGAKIARCLDGARACPPEDCGGIWGYEDLLKIIRNPRHEEHKDMLEWLGGPFDPEAFEPQRANTFLRKLKWPHVTVEQLASVLMQRDGVAS